MNNGMRYLLILTALLSFSACSKVPAGSVGVKVYLLGGKKGVDHELLGPGRYWMGWNTDMYLFPTFQQNHNWPTPFSFQTAEGMSINTNLGISYHLEPDKISNLFQKYRRGVDEITDTYIHNMVRDALFHLGSKDSIGRLISGGNERLIMDVENEVRAQVDTSGIKIDKIFMTGRFDYPTQVDAAITAKIEATQRAQQSENELQRAKAEAAKEIATAEGTAKSKLIAAESEAQANKLKLQTLTPELIRYEAIQKWDGKLPQVSGGNNVPFLNIDMGGK